jgi:hypothetical protein
MTISLNEVAAWSIGIIIWCVICVVGWYVVTRGDYTKLASAGACYSTNLQSQNTGTHCENSKPSDILLYKAALDRKAAISRVVAVFGSMTAVGLLILVERRRANLSAVRDRRSQTMKLTHKPLVVVTLASTLVAPPLSAFAQQGLDQQHLLPPQRAQNINPTPGQGPGPRGARLAHGPLPLHNFGGHVYHGHLAWEHGSWHHETRNGRYGWWWDVGGAWYFYPQPIEGPPDHVSDISVAEEATAEPAPPPQASHHTFYYHPGDIKGVPYDTIKECLQATQRAGNVGVCVMK